MQPAGSFLQASCVWWLQMLLYCLYRSVATHEPQTSGSATCTCKHSTTAQCAKRQSLCTVCIYVWSATACAQEATSLISGCAGVLAACRRHDRQGGTHNVVFPGQRLPSCLSCTALHCSAALLAHPTCRTPYLPLEEGQRLGLCQDASIPLGVASTLGPLAISCSTVPVRHLEAALHNLGYL